MAFPFLDLPPEIRRDIYIQVCQVPHEIPLHAGPYHDAFPHDLLLTCHQIYQEARPIYFTHNQFYIYLDRRTMPLDDILDPAFSDNLRLVNYLRLHIRRWGRSGYFLRVLVPVLLDLILNHHLRNVTIDLKMTDVLIVKEGEEIRLNWDSENIREVIRILEDPYLERSSLRVFSGSYDKAYGKLPSFRWQDTDVPKIDISDHLKTGSKIEIDIAELRP